MNETNEKRETLRELLIIAAGELVVLGLLYGAYALLGRLNGKVLLGGAVGAGTAVLNYFLTALGVFRAAEKAQQGDTVGAMRTVRLSMYGRYLLMILVLVAGAKSGWCNVIAMVIPLVLFRVLLFVGEFFRRKDG